MLLDHIHYQSETPVHSKSRAPLLLSVGFSLFFLALLFVSARLLVNWKLRRLGREDALIATSTVLTLSLLTTTAVMSRFGFGMHTADIPLEWQPIYSKYVYSICILGTIPFALNKLSMLCFYLRLAPHPNFRIICYISIMVIIVLHSLYVVINMAGCNPIRGGWNHDLSLHAKCIANGYFYYAMSISSIITDILLLLLPIPILLQLQVRKTVKLGLVVMFSMGFLITGVSAFSLYTVYRSLNTMDNAWDGGFSWMISLVECNVAIMTANMPGAYAFIRWVHGDPVGGVALPKPDPESDSGTIGHRRFRRYRSDPTATELTSVGSHNGSEEYVLHGLEVAVSKTEVEMEEGVRR